MLQAGGRLWAWRTCTAARPRLYLQPTQACSTARGGGREQVDGKRGQSRGGGAKEVGEKRVKSVERLLKSSSEGLLRADTYETLGAASRASHDPETKYVRDSDLGLIRDRTGKTKNVPLFSRPKWSREDLMKKHRSTAADLGRRTRDTVKSDREIREKSRAVSREMARKEQHLRRTQPSIVPAPREDPPQPLARPLLPEEEEHIDGLLAQSDPDSPEYVKVVTARRRRLNAVESWAKREHPDNWTRIVTRISLKESLKGKAWAPTVLVTYEAMDSMRDLHADSPEIWTTAALAKKFKVSMTAVNKILHNKFQATPEQRVIRRMEVGAFWGLVTSQKKKKARRIRNAIFEEDLKERYGDLYLSEEAASSAPRQSGEEVVFDEETIARFEATGAYERLEQGQEGDEEATVRKSEKWAQKFEEEHGEEEASVRQWKEAKKRKAKGAAAPADEEDLDFFSEIEAGVGGEEVPLSEEGSEREFLVHERDVEEWLSGGEVVTKRNILLEAKELVRHKLKRMHLRKYAMARNTFLKAVSEERKAIAERQWLENTEKSPEQLYAEEKKKNRAFWNLGRYKRERDGEEAAGLPPPAPHGHERRRVSEGRWQKRSKAEAKQAREELADGRRPSDAGGRAQERRRPRKAEEKAEVTTRRLQRALDGSSGSPAVPGMTKRKYIRWKDPDF